MSKQARIVNSVAVDVVIGDPSEFFHPDIAKGFVPVPDQVESGWSVSAGNWSPPAPVEPATPSVIYPKVGPIHFQMLFHPAEVVAADELKATDKVLASFWKLVDDPRTDVIDLSLMVVQNAIEYTLTVVKAAGVDLDVQQRKAEILTGALQ
jgi:hypothetical protein